MEEKYRRKNRRKFSLKVHIVLVTKYRKQILKGSIADVTKTAILNVANKKNYSIISMEMDKDHVHILLEYGATESVSDIVKTIKQTTTYVIWNSFPDYLSKLYWRKKNLWSDGYFACSIGEVSSATIQKYIESQG